MLTALSTLPAQLKADPAPVSGPRPGAPFDADNSFASLIRRQAEQRLDTLRLADQQALAARVSAAAATPMPRPLANSPVSRPPVPNQASAKPSPPPSPSPSPQSASPSPSPSSSSSTSRSPAPSEAAAPAMAATSADGSQAMSDPAGPPQAAAARPKPPGSARRPETPGSPAAHSGPADGPSAARSPRERKLGTAISAEPAADAAIASATGLPVPLPLPMPLAQLLPLPLPPAVIGATGLVGDGREAAGPDLAAGLQADSALPPDLGAQAAAQSPAVAGPPAGPGAEAAVATGPIRSAPALASPSAASSALANAEARPATLAQAPAPALADAPVPARADAAAPTASPNLSPNAKAPAPDADPQGLGAAAAVTAGGTPESAVGAQSVPQADTPIAPRRRSSAGLDALPAAQQVDAAAAAQTGAWRPGSAPASGTDRGAPAEPQPASRRADHRIDQSGPEPHLAAGPAAASGPAGAALQAALGQPDGAAPRAFDSALQATLAQGQSAVGAGAGTPAGSVANAQAKAEPTLTMRIDAAIDSPLFAPTLGSQLSLLARDGVRSALLQLHPAEMGPISVVIALDGNAAHIDFQALRADTRSLIEASLPALAGALQDAGLTLAGGGVFEQAPGQQPQAKAEPGPRAQPAGPVDKGQAGAFDSAQSARRTAPRGLVDLVA